MQITSQELLIFLQVVAFLLLIIGLWQLLFIAVDLRRILRRVEVLTKQVEDVIAKPIAVADWVVEDVADFVEEQQKKKSVPKKTKKK